MKNSNHIKYNVALPPDMINVIISYIPELNDIDLIKLRSVSKDFKFVIDSIITKPLNVINLLGELNENQRSIYFNYYVNSANAGKLSNLSNDLLNTLEKICVACVKYHKHDKTKADSLDRIIMSHLNKISCYDVLEIVTQVSPGAARQVLMAYISLNKAYLKKLCNKKSFNIYAYEKKYGDDKYLYQSLDLANMLILTLGSKDINTINKASLNDAIGEFCLTKQYIDNSSSMINIVDSVRVTLAALNKDWDTVRSGSTMFVNLSSAKLDHAVLCGANLTGANLFKVNFMGSDLEDANFFKAHLVDANLLNANLKGCNFRWAVLNDASLTLANLENADLSCSDMTGVMLSHANLKNTRFDSVNMRKIDWKNFPDYDLKHADLTNSIWFDRSLDKFGNSLSKLMKYPSLSSCRAAIASDLIRVLHNNEPEVAIKLLTEAIKSPIFEPKKIASKVVTSIAGMFKDNALPSKSKKLLLDERKRLVKMQDKHHTVSKQTKK